MNGLLKALQTSKEMSQERFNELEKIKKLDKKIYNFNYTDNFFEVYLNKDSYLTSNKITYTNVLENEINKNLSLAV